MTRPLIRVRAYSDKPALEVLENLDLNDATEVVLMRGPDDAGALAMLSDWRMVNKMGAVSFIAFVEGADVPFAVMSIAPDGMPGCGRAALLAKDHRLWRRELVVLAGMICKQLPVIAASMGLHRIEARTWSNHPTASALLSAVGFSLDADMPGFGVSGELSLRQFSWVADYISNHPSLKN